MTRDPNVQWPICPQTPVMDGKNTVLEQVFSDFPAEFRALNEYEARTILTRLGITDFDRKVGTLSGGQRKRVALATVFVHPLDILVRTGHQPPGQRNGAVAGATPAAVHRRGDRHTMTAIFWTAYQAHRGAPNGGSTSTTPNIPNTWS